jgi:hypothetical protein
MILEVFNCQKWRKENFIDFLYLVFNMYNQNIKKRLNICASYLVYSQIWLNLHKHDWHFTSSYVWCDFGYIKNFLRKN